MRAAVKLINPDSGNCGCKVIEKSVYEMGSLGGVKWYRGTVCGQFRDQIPIYAHIGNMYVIEVARVELTAGGGADIDAALCIKKLGIRAINSRLRVMLNASLIKIRGLAEFNSMELDAIMTIGTALGVEKTLKIELDTGLKNRRLLKEREEELKRRKELNVKYKKVVKETKKQLDVVNLTLDELRRVIATTNNASERLQAESEVNRRVDIENKLYELKLRQEREETKKKEDIALQKLNEDWNKKLRNIYELVTNYVSNNEEVLKKNSELAEITSEELLELNDEYMTLYYEIKDKNFGVYDKYNKYFANILPIDNKIMSVHGLGCLYDKVVYKGEMYGYRDRSEEVKQLVEKVHDIVKKMKKPLESKAHRLNNQMGISGETFLKLCKECDISVEEDIGYWISWGVASILVDAAGVIHVRNFKEEHWKKVKDSFLELLYNLYTDHITIANNGFDIECERFTSKLLRYKEIYLSNYYERVPLPSWD